MAKTKRNKHSISEGKVFIQATFNNTMVTVTDIQGNVISWSSSGSLGFKGAKKSTPYASQLASEKALSPAVDQGLQSVHVLVKGPGMGREAAIRALGVAGVRVLSIKDVTPIPHNGCRPRKTRRN